MDEHVREIIEFERKSLNRVDEERLLAAAEIEAFVRKMDEYRNSEFERIRKENRENAELAVRRAGEKAQQVLDELKLSQERLLEDDSLRKEIKEMIQRMITESG